MRLENLIHDEVPNPLSMAHRIPKSPEFHESDTSGIGIHEFPLSLAIEVGVQVSESSVFDVSVDQLSSSVKEPHFHADRNENSSVNSTAPTFVPEQSSSFPEESSVKSEKINKNSSLNPRAPTFVPK